MSHFKGPDLAVELPQFQPNTSVLKLLAESLKKNGDSTAMVEGQTGRTATFKDFLRQSTAISVGLRKVGVTAGDYVILCCDKNIAAFSALMGVIFTGATAIIYPILHVGSVPKVTQGFPIKAVFCDRQYHDTLTKSMSKMVPQPIIVAVTEPQDRVFTTLLSTKGDLEVYEVKDVKKHVPMIFFSSGTTGDPKGVELSDVGVQLCGRYLKVDINTFFVFSPMFWLSSLVSLTSAIFKNFTIISSNSLDPKENLQLVEKYKVDVWFTNIGSLPRYINEPTLPTFDLSSLDGVAVGGEIMLSSVAENFKVKMSRGKTKLISGYGTTEGGLLSNLVMNLEEETFKYGLCGKLNAGVEMKIVGEDGKIMPVGELGEVLVLTPGITPGYWGRPELHDEVFDKDGFFRTGDVGFFNQEGQIFIRGRLVDLVNYKGTKISPAEVEDVLMSHPAVLEAAVVGKSHPTDNQHMTAYIVKKPGHEVTEKELHNLVNGKVADTLRLRGGIYFLDVLPRVIVGKVIRKKLREM